MTTVGITDEHNRHNHIDTIVSYAILPDVFTTIGAHVARDSSPQSSKRAVPDLDVIVVGAGLSGIAAAYRLQLVSGLTFEILEARHAIGGTWDLFRYPGIRSDSDMQTLGFGFRPWTGNHAIASGEDIRNYIVDTARAFGIEKTITFGRRVTSARWSSDEAMWTLEVARSDGWTEIRTCRFLYMGSGYYDYGQGHLPQWPGMETFQGQWVHPQHWPADLDYSGKRVVVIGSGATAITLAPAMAETAAQVTMLQRSPTYVVARPGVDTIANGLRRVLPGKAAYGLARWKNILLSMYLFRFSRRRPAKARAMIQARARRALGDGFDMAHFTPRYDPWDQRICLVPDGDLFDSLKAGKITIVTDTIASFTPTGIHLESGDELAADIVVTATGLKVQMMGGARIVVDGCCIDLSKRLTYKGMMFQDVPNLVYALGYTNASWTLKCELTAAYFARLIKHMRAKGLDTFAAHHEGPAPEARSALDLTSGYVQRAADVLPKQGSRHPWRVHNNYVRDLMATRFSGLADDAMQFGRVARKVDAEKAAQNG